VIGFGGGATFLHFRVMLFAITVQQMHIVRRQC